MTPAACYLSARKNCHPLAITAEDAIERMPSTSHNDEVVLAALIQRYASATHADFSEVLQALDEVVAALAEVRSYSQEELNEGYAALAAQNKAKEVREVQV